MKKIFSLVAVALMIAACGTVSAQCVLKIGYSNVNFTKGTTIGGVTSEKSWNDNGIYVGAAHNYSFLGLVGIEPGIDINYYGNHDDNGTTETTRNALSVIVPVNLNVALPLGTKAKIMVLAGPAFNIGIIAKKKTTFGGISTEVDHYDADVSDDDKISRFNLELGVGARLIYGSLGINVGYQLGLLNTSGADKDYYSYRSNRLLAGLSFNL